MIQGISENDMIALTIELWDQCRSHKIPSQVFDAITTKKLYMVHWYSTIADYGSGMTYYQLSDMEIHQIAKAPWKWLSIWYGPGGQYEPTLAQYKILRNEKTSVREGFEPNGVPFYTREEFDRCQQSAQKDRSKDVNTSTDNINSCLKELPPLP
jgi:hypothetical protein